MSELKGTNIAAPVVPFTGNDTYPTHYSLYGKGGHKEVATIDERNSIPADRLTEGTIVYVAETDKEYQYKNGEFVAYKGDKGDKGDALEFRILGSYVNLGQLVSAYPDGPLENGLFKVGDLLYAWTGSAYEILNLDVFQTFSLEQFIEVNPVGSDITVDFSKTPYAKVSLSGGNRIHNLSIVNTKEGVCGKILVFQTGFKQVSVAENIKGTVDLPLNANTIALLTYNRIGDTIYMHSNTVLGDVQFPTPQRISDFSITYYDNSVCAMTWTAPYANNIYDSATEYDMR